MIFFSNFQWHDLEFLAMILISLSFLGKINCQDVGKTPKKIQDLGKKFKITQGYPRFYRENQGAKHWVEII